MIPVATYSPPKLWEGEQCCAEGVEGGPSEGKSQPVIPVATYSPLEVWEESNAVHMVLRGNMYPNRREKPNAVGVTESAF